MKNFTKKLMLMLTGILTFQVAFSQADITVTSYDYPVAGTDSIYSDVAFPIPFTLDILSGQANAGDTIWVGVAMNQVEINQYFVVLAQNWTTGAQSLYIPSFDPGTVTNGNTRFCVYSKYSNESDLSNDSTCNIIDTKNGTPPVDLSPTAINDPADGSNVDVNSGTYQMSLDITNIGPYNYPIGSVVQYEVSVCGNTQGPFFGTITAGHFFTDSVTTRPVNVNIPSTPGPCEICVTTVQPNDIDNTNDEFCIDVTLVGEPTGIENSSIALSNNLYYANEEIYINISQQEASSLEIVNSIGQVVQSTQLVGTGNIQQRVAFTGNPAGMYIANIRSGEEIIETTKFIVQ